VNTKLKRRLGVVTGVIVIVILVVLAVVSASTASKTLTVADAASGDYKGSKVQVTGKVVDNSYSTANDILTFSIYDDTADPTTQLVVSYDKGISATFGNQVTAICTGTINAQGVLVCTELVTKCPSKYENATDALGVSQLLSYGEGIYDKPVKVAGAVKAGTLKPAGQGDRFILVDTTDGGELPISYSEALSETIEDGSVLVVTGSISSSGKFLATDVALKG
jgi:cytochrome c-type biogenesis protein CcmE